MAFAPRCRAFCGCIRGRVSENSDFKPGKRNIYRAIDEWAQYDVSIRRSERVLGQPGGEESALRETIGGRPVSPMRSTSVRQHTFPERICKDKISPAAEIRLCCQSIPRLQSRRIRAGDRRGRCEHPESRSPLRRSPRPVPDRYCPFPRHA